jgi:diacylglycerol kinase family enzyme
MNGKYYGGGMIPTPEQKRTDDTLSVMVFHGSGKLKSLMIFPSIFKGEHVKKTKNITVLSGKEITVKYDSPRALQIDGETISGVSEYTAKK